MQQEVLEPSHDLTRTWLAAAFTEEWRSRFLRDPRLRAFFTSPQRSASTQHGELDEGGLEVMTHTYKALNHILSVAHLNKEGVCFL